MGFGVWVWVHPDQLHRLEGIFIYFGFLLLLFALEETVSDTAETKYRKHTLLLKRAVVPLVIYWLTTLGVPLLNGAYSQQAGFLEHSLFVLITPLILMLPLGMFLYMRDRKL